jgi:hypothetical protein
MYFRTLSPSAEELRQCSTDGVSFVTIRFDPPHFQHVDEVPDISVAFVDVHEVEPHDVVAGNDVGVDFQEPFDEALDHSLLGFIGIGLAVGYFVASTHNENVFRNVLTTQPG